MSDSVATFTSSKASALKSGVTHTLGLTIGLRLLVACIVIVVWEALVVFNLSTPFWISQPRLIAVRLMQDTVSPDFWYDVFVTLYETLIGLAVGATLGGVSGYLLARYRLLDLALEPYLIALYSLPRVALAPLFILWFGIGLMSKVALAVSIVYFILLMNVYSGVKAVDPDLLNAARTMGARNGYVTRHIILPSCVPWIFSGLRIALGMALIGTVVGEMIASQFGLGRLIAVASGSFDTTGVFATLIVLALLAMILNAVMQRTERYLQRWQGDTNL